MTCRGVASCRLNASAFQYYAGTTHLVHFAAKPFVDHESFEASQRVHIYRYDPNVPNFETSTLAIEHSSHEFHPAKINGSLSTPFNAYVYSVPITPPLPAGSVIFARLRMYNRAGVSIESDSRPIMLDDTRPQHPSLSSCEEADSIQVGLNHWLQRNQSGISVCWPAPGFRDPESGIWKLEWQVSFLTNNSYLPGTMIKPRAGVWNSFGPFVAATSDDKLFGPTAVSSLWMTAAIGDLPQSCKLECSRAVAIDLRYVPSTAPAYRASIPASTRSQPANGPSTPVPAVRSKA